ncbi:MULTISPECIES: hypothetical protein [Paraburkholderia]|uniref:hypothetical protein n=1 Tax=Paraburkholderia TaxID=1822464 RepID=UPI00225BA196|nr:MULTISPECIES: hypothetical protein [Paraburkholderia]MCX4172732.1 hypothetical protein [Paraburkholderia madseniana]MDQ6460740.1 hypothetical protein [Paraburkholderia madseniana]
MKIKIASLITYLFLANCACAQVEGDALSVAPFDQAGYGEGTFTVSSFSARKAEADALKGHYRIRYAGRKNRIAAEKEESEYQAPSYSEQGALVENTLDPSAVSNVKTQQVSGMLAGGIGQKRGLGQRPGSSSLMAGMSRGMGASGGMGVGAGASARIGIGATGGLSMARGTSVAAVAGVGMGSGTAMRVMRNKVSSSMGGMGSAENTDASDELLQSDLGGSTPGSGITGSQSFSDLGR